MGLSIAMGIPSSLAKPNSQLNYAFFDSDKDDDGGLKLDVLAYIKDSDPMKDQILTALDEISCEHDKSVMIIMPKVTPLLYRKNFEITPNFVKLQGALFNSPLCISNFNYGMMLEAIKSGSATWGIPHTIEQLNNRNGYRESVAHNVTARSESSIKADLTKAVLEKDKNRDDVKKIWSKGIQNGLLPISSYILDAVRG
jgi:hypothetical protein